MKELLDRRNNWVFVSPEEMMQSLAGGKSSSTPEYSPDGTELNLLSTVERYYLRMSRAGGRTNESGASAFRDMRGDTNEWGRGWSYNGSAASFAAFGEYRSLPKDLLSSSWSADGSPASISDFFKSNDGMTPEAIRNEKMQAAQIDEFRKILDLQSSPVMAAPLNSPAGQASVVANPGLSGGYASGQPGRPGSIPGVIHSQLTPPVAPLAPLAPGQSSLSPAPYITPAKVARTQSNYSAPQRKF